MPTFQSYLFIIFIQFVLYLCPGSIWAHNKRVAEHTGVQSVSYLNSLVRKYSGFLLVSRGMKSRKAIDVRRKSTRELITELHDTKLIRRDYQIRNRRFYPSIVAPIVFGGIGAVTQLLSIPWFLASIYSNSARPLPPGGSVVNPNIYIAFTFLGIGTAILIGGIIWLVVQMYQRRQTPHYQKIIQLGNRYQMLLDELKRRKEHSGTHLPHVYCHGFSIPF